MAGAGIPFLANLPGDSVRLGLGIFGGRASSSVRGGLYVFVVQIHHRLPNPTTVHSPNSQHSLKPFRIRRCHRVEPVAVPTVEEVHRMARTAVKAVGVDQGLADRPVSVESDEGAGHMWRWRVRSKASASTSTSARN